MALTIGLETLARFASSVELQPLPAHSRLTLSESSTTIRPPVGI
ncbi:MAG: hypothetical protein ABI401_01935 [Candidatus Dormibacter sp.]